MPFSSPSHKTVIRTRLFRQKNFPRSKDLLTYQLLLYFLQQEKQIVINTLQKNRYKETFLLFSTFSPEAVLYSLAFGLVPHLVNSPLFFSFFFSFLISTEQKRFSLLHTLLLCFTDLFFFFFFFYYYFFHLHYAYRSQCNCQNKQTSKPKKNACPPWNKCYATKFLFISVTESESGTKGYKYNYLT